MILDLRVPVGRPVPEVVDFVARCEDAGLDGIGIHDHPHSARDVYVTLGLAAARSRRLRVYPATSSPAVRHPVLLASAAHTLAEVAPGRSWLTVAPGFLSARSVGQPRAGVDAMREAILGIRALLRGQAVAFGDPPSRLRNLDPEPPPVFLLAAGPRMVELAGEVADGAFLEVGLAPAGVAAARAALQTGARRAGRSLENFRTVFVVTWGLDDDPAVGRRWIRSWFAPGQPFLAYPSAGHLHWLRAAGLEVPDPLRPEAIPEPLADRVADAFGLFGPAERCADRLLEAREEAGIDHVFLFPAHTLEGGYRMPEAEVEAVRSVLRPRLGGGGPA